MKRIYLLQGLILSGLCLFTHPLRGQEDFRAHSKHELSVNGFSGLQGLHYSISGTNLQNATISKQFGGGGGLGYAYKVNTRWAIQTGVDFSYYSTKAEIATIPGTYEATGALFSYQTENYEETQKLLQVEIPVLARYTAHLNLHNAIQVAAGLKIGIPVSTDYSSTVGGHTTKSAYLSLEDVIYNFDNIFPPNAAAKVNGYAGKFETNVSLQLQLEGGYRYSLSEKLGMYAGVYFQYGLNNMQKKSNGELVTFTAGNEMNVKPPVYSYGESLLNTAMVESFRPMAIGVKIRLCFGL